MTLIILSVVFALFSSALYFYIRKRINQRYMEAIKRYQFSTAGLN